MNFLGRVAYQLSRPVLRFYLSRTTRTYGLIVGGGQVLVVQNWLGRQGWSLPGGGVRAGEPCKVALSREVKEETGLIIEPQLWRPVSKGRWQTDKLGFSYIIYRADIKQTRAPGRRWPEVVKSTWLAPTELIAKCDVEVITTLKSAHLV